MMKNFTRRHVLMMLAILASASISQVASALPIFARQTGASCNQCHFQGFPKLTAFGRSFKNSGFTMVGMQRKVEGEGLSIPESLNFGVLTTAGIETVSNPDPANGIFDSTNTPGGGGELSIFYGGRVTPNIGFLTELGAAGAAVTSSAKMPIFFEVSPGTRAGVVLLTTDGQGAAHSFETLNTGAVGVQRMVPMGGVNSNDAHIKVNSAAQYLGTKTGAQGASFVVNNEHYFVNVGKYAMLNTDIGKNTRSSSMGMSYMRAAGLFDLAGFDSAIGVQMFRGDDAGFPDPATGVAGIKTATDATIIDGQMQGKVGNMPLGVYFSYGTAPAVNDANLPGGNHFNAGNVNTASSLNIAVQVGVVPKTTLMAAMRMAKNGAVDAVNTDNALMVGTTYEMAENVEASLSYTTQSGSAWDSVGGVEPPGKTVTTLMLEVLF